MRKHPRSLSLQERYDNLQSFCQEMASYIRDLENDIAQVSDDLRYLHAFISYYNLDKEFQFFKENAHEEYREDLPFPELTL